MSAALIGRGGNEPRTHYLFLCCFFLIHPSSLIPFPFLFCLSPLTSSILSFPSPLSLIRSPLLCSSSSFPWLISCVLQLLPFLSPLPSSRFLSSHSIPFFSSEIFSHGRRQQLIPKSCSEKAAARRRPSPSKQTNTNRTPALLFFRASFIPAWLQTFIVSLSSSSSSSSPLTSRPESMQSTVCWGGTLGIAAMRSWTYSTEWAEEAHSSLEL